MALQQKKKNLPAPGMSPVTGYPAVYCTEVVANWIFFLISFLTDCYFYIKYYYYLYSDVLSFNLAESQKTTFHDEVLYLKVQEGLVEEVRVTQIFGFSVLHSFNVDLHS